MTLTWHHHIVVYAQNSPLGLLIFLFSACPSSIRLSAEKAEWILVLEFSCKVMPRQSSGEMKMVSKRDYDQCHLHAVKVVP